MLLLVVPLLLFLLITWQVLADGPLLDLDARLSEALVRPDRASELLSDLGNVEVAVPVLALALAVTAWRLRARGVDRWWLPPAAGAAAMLLVPVLVAPLKAWTDRPGTPAVPPATGYFPSGHTATAVVAYGAATLLLLRLLGSPAVRRGLIALCALLILGASSGGGRGGNQGPVAGGACWGRGAVLLAGVVLVSRSSRRTSAGTPSRRSGPS
ncbi:phosphatase PAP2 family protein [Streptomyces albogriseolus]|uniref:hypothetical protein n=1 Tax=Streptomyces albogriseolus TaxID=1887 RepID=UPI0036A2E88D